MGGLGNPVDSEWRLALAGREGWRLIMISHAPLSGHIRGWGGFAFHLPNYQVLRRCVG